VVDYFNFCLFQDVLILEQFTNSKGKQLPRDVTGLCKEQHKRLDYLLVMAEKAGMIVGLRLIWV